MFGGTVPFVIIDDGICLMNDGLKRRDFLKVIGTSSAGAGMLGCSTEKVEKLMPYVTAPEEITPGVATWYSTSCGECEAGLWNVGTNA